MNKKNNPINMLNDMTVGQMKPFQLNRKDDLIKMLNEAKHILIAISKDEGGMISDHVISTAKFEFNEDFLTVNAQIQIPIHDENIEFADQDNAEINYIDSDGFITNIKIFSR